MFFKSFDNRLYKTLFGCRDWTCSIARRTGPMAGQDGSTIPATGKSLEPDFCTVALTGRADRRGALVL